MSEPDSRIVEAARAIRPHLGALIGAAAPGLDAELGAMLNADGPDEARLLQSLQPHPDVLEWTLRLAADGPEALVVLRLGLYGQGEQIPLTKFACPVGADTVWYRRQVGEQTPRCTSHDVELVRVEDAG